MRLCNNITYTFIYNIYVQSLFMWREKNFGTKSSRINYKSRGWLFNSLMHSRHPVDVWIIIYNLYYRRRTLVARKNIHYG